MTSPELIACACRDFSTRFFLTMVVVQNVPLGMTGNNIITVCDVTECHVTSKGHPWKGGVRACANGSCAISALVGPFHWKLCNIRSNVNRRAYPIKYGSAHARLEVPLGCSLGHPGPITLSFSTNKPFHWLSAPLPPCGAPTIITQPFVRRK